MAELIAKTPCAGLLPIMAGSTVLSELDLGRMTSVSPFSGRDKAVSKALKEACGMAFPGPLKATGKAGARAIWFGSGQAMVVGPDVPDTLGADAALTDQSDAWAVLELKGAEAIAALARLVPVDLRISAFKTGSTTRTQLQHMMSSITRTSADSFMIMVMRSFAQTAVHDLKRAMESAAAQG